MSKIIVVLLIALIFEAVGVVFLSRGLKQIGEMERVNLREIGRLVMRGAANPAILTGVAFETIFFAGLLYLLSKAEVSLVWPLTSLGFVLTTLAAKILGHEDVSPLRWSGVILIVLGAAIVGWSEKIQPASSNDEVSVQHPPR